MDRHVEAFLEMLAAERGAARNTLAAYAADLATPRASLPGAGRRCPAGRGDAARLSRGAVRRAGCRRAPRRGGCRRCGSSTASCCARACGRTTRPSCSTRRGCRAACRNTCPRRRSTRCWPRPPRARRRRRPLLRAALEILYATGLRVSELLALPRTALAGDAALLLVRGKGGKERVVPLSDAAREAAAAARRPGKGAGCSPDAIRARR